MSSTTVVIELILVGFQVLLWISLLVLAAFGHSWIDLPGLKDWSGPIAALLAGVAYMLGVLFDRLARAFRFRWTITGSAAASGLDLPSPIEMRMRIGAKSEVLYNAVEQRANHIRLVRSTALNAALICISLMVFAMARLDVSWGFIVLLVAVTLVIVGLAALDWYQSTRVFLVELVSAYRAVEAKTEK